MSQYVSFRRTAELAATQHGVIRRTQAADHHVQRHHLLALVSKGVLDEVHPGVFRFVGAPQTWRQRLALATAAAEGTHASHRAAARLHRLDGFDRAPIEVLVARGRYPSIDGVVTHRWRHLDEADLAVVDGIPCTGVAMTLAQLGAVVHLDRLEAALESALRHGYPLEHLRATAHRLHRPGRSGTGKLLQLLADPARRADPTDSELERLTHRILVDARIPPPVLQHEVEVITGQRFRLDFAWPPVRVGLESHSRRYHFGREKEARDHERDLLLAREGWDVQYVTSRQLHDPEPFVHHLAGLLATRARQLGVPLAPRLGS